MVCQIVWTAKALETYLHNIYYLQENWTGREVANFILLVERKIEILSKQLELGIAKNKKTSYLRNTLLHKRISLVYKIVQQKQEIHLLIFWNTYQNPSRLKAK